MAIKPGWSRPSTILFASEIPANEKAFNFALAQAQEFAADIVIFHAYDTLIVAASETSGIRYYDYAAAARDEITHLEPLARRAREAGIRCDVVVRPGLAADQILHYIAEHEVDRIVMGTHSPGPIGKLLVGSVAEAVLRTAKAPVFIVGADRTIDEIEMDMLSFVPPELRDAISVQSVVVPGDPTEELLYQSRAQQADLIVLGAQGASAFAAIARHGVVYKVLAHSHCPVITLSPAVLAWCGVKYNKEHPAEVFLAGVF